MSLLAPLFQLTLQDSGSLRGSVNEIWSPKRTEKKKDEIKLKHFRLLKARDNLMHLNLPYVCLTRKCTVLFVSTAIYSPLVDLGATKKWGFQTWVEWSTGKINQRSSPTSLCSATSTETLIRICTYCTIIQWFITIFAPKKNRFKFQVHLIEISLHTDRRLHPEFKIHWRCCDTQAALKFNPTCTGVTVSDQSCGDGARPCDVSAQHLGFCLVLFHLFLSIRCATGNSADP